MERDSTHFSTTASSELARSVPVRVSSELTSRGHRLLERDVVDGHGLHLLAHLHVARE